MLFSFFSCIIVESKTKRNFSAKDFQCIVCENMKRRCDVVVFAKKDYDFNLDSVKEVLSKYNDDNKVTFVCLQCRYYLRGLSLGKQKTDMKKPSSETDYLCTCCHSIFK